MTILYDNLSLGERVITVSVTLDSQQQNIRKIFFLMSIYQHFENTENKVFVIRHSRISPGDSCISQLLSIIRDIKFFDPLLANVHILCPLKTPENLWFSGVFRGYKMGTFARNGLKNSYPGAEEIKEV